MIHELLSHYRTWGPSARICIRLAEGSLTVDEHAYSASAAADRFASDPRQLSTEVSHVLFAVRQEKLSADSKGVVRVQIPTKHLNGIIALSVARLDAARQSLFFSHMS